MSGPHPGMPVPHTTPPKNRVVLAPDPEHEGVAYQTFMGGAIGLSMGAFYGMVGSAFSKEQAATASFATTSRSIGKYSALFGLGFAVYGGVCTTVTQMRGQLDLLGPLLGGASCGVVMGGLSTRKPTAALVMGGIFAIVGTLAEMGNDPTGTYLIDLSKYDGMPVMVGGHASASGIARPKSE
ncbi:hypothetical protein T492DRAFT_938229 [Pavlovales sp. CCMP2436]|nr:hypothetical protein T492DRAFT_938229 [Pavlovales sp. CCMP2436]|mmetsp:Transcript_30996/g.71162  ORF Transcript_30996/g.71162 Transcript_30996/m.71162 type:complete len:182 (-) Transcript_30996:371-916(-)